MSINAPASRLFVFAALCFTLAACGGGGGGSVAPTAPGGSASTTPSPTPTSTTTSSTATVTGKAVDYTTGAPLVGLIVSLGAVPSTNCVQTNTSNSCGGPVSPVTTTTAADGSFAISAQTGTSMLTIAPATANAYATLHRTIVSTSPAIGTLKLMALSSDVQSWLADTNAVRLAAAVPASYANLTVDEYAQEQATLWAAAVSAGTTVYGDAGYAPYQTAYADQPGAMYVAGGDLAVEPQTLAFATTFGSSASGQVTLQAGAPGWQIADAGWEWGDKSNCSPPYSWNTSACSTNSGHYVNLSNTLDVWIGLGETSAPDAANGGQFPYDLMLIQD